MMVKIVFSEFKDIENDVDFCIKLYEEQSCITMPSRVFFSSGFIRLVITI
jgi:aspartate/methionine/tyrosine aminotransferase